MLSIDDEHCLASSVYNQTMPVSQLDTQCCLSLELEFNHLCENSNAVSYGGTTDALGSNRGAKASDGLWEDLRTACRCVACYVRKSQNNFMAAAGTRQGPSRAT